MSEYLKALAPAGLSLAAVLGSWIATGAFDRIETGGIIAGALTALIVYAVPNAEPLPKE